MAVCSRSALGLALLVARGVSTAHGLDGSWSTRVERAGEEILYEVNLGHSHGRLIGTWSVDTFQSSAGCLLGEPARKIVVFQTCTTDGSAGARDMQAVCPEYHADRNRLVLAGSKLTWQTWDEQRHSWRKFVVLERSQNARPLAWNEEECGKL